ncbi:rhodanese-like domain-containing protein [uncultured Azohydromonas sp.]|jgi:Rhodanese-related sulfurtransferase|uniref:rhodanese-like domain-containing protein n=1 Tax=uncultured Azohydromonas sp. TaxID=487342 RepID=UPI0026269E67|nr:rhodanese-like domain-containing protein [uncultured Azohydromonas sp.]
MKIKTLSALVLLAAALAAPHVSAQDNAAPAAAQQARAWKYKTKRLNAAEVDALLAQPEKLLVLDLRRPDELIRYGSFPAFLNIQNAEIDTYLAYLPKDRVILTVSNHALRAGATGDALAAKGYVVAGATGSEDYEQEGGKAVRHIQPRPPRNAASAPAAR